MRLRRSSMPNEFVTDIKTLRERARKHIENGAVTEGYKADRDTVIRLLQEALATEIVCVLRYKRHYFMAQGIHAQAVAAEFLQHANEEQGHADQISARIVQLGGAPNLNPDGLTSRSHSEYVETGYAAARQGAVLVDLPDRGVLAVTGALRQKFLHGVLSNDVLGLLPGQGRRAALMDAKGHLLAFMRVLVGQTEAWLEVAGKRT